MARAIATGLRGLLALRRGDSARARGLLLDAYQWETRQTALPAILFPSIAFSLALARLELAAGDARSALRRLSDAYPPHQALAFIPEALELRGRVSEVLGDTASARQAYRNLTRLLEGADPELQPMRAAAQAALARLGAIAVC